MTYSLFSLWKSIKPGGMYVIEDLETNYWPHNTQFHEYKLNHTGIGAKPEHSVVTKVEQIQQVLVRRQIGARELSVMPGDEDICAIDWGMNVVAIRKCATNIDRPPYENKKFYDEKRMKEWVAEARRTNPDVSKDVVQQ